MKKVLLALLILAPLAQAQEASSQTGSISGVVHDSEGKPARAAEVWCVWRTEPEKRLAKSRTDGEGYFVLGNIPVSANSVRVFATAPGLSRGSDHTSINSSHLASRVDIRLWDADTIRGRVVDANGQPISGVKVTASNESSRVFGGDSQGEDITDQEGRFEMTKVPLGEITVRAWAPRHVIASTVFWHADETEGVELALAKGKGVTLAVQVKGLPEGVKASLSVRPYSDGSFQILPAPMNGGLDAAGRWELAGLPDYRFDVRVRAEGYSFNPRRRRVEPGNKSHELEFTVVKDETNVLSGTLRDQAGKPLAGQRLQCRASNGGRRTEAKTAEDGSFSIQSPLAPGAQAMIYLLDSSFVPVPKKPVANQSFRARPLSSYEFVVDPKVSLEIVAQPAASVSGVLRDTTGRGIPFQRVTLQEFTKNRAPGWMVFKNGTTDREGQFHFVGIRPPSDQIRVACGRKSAAQATEGFVLDDGEDKKGSPKGVVGLEA